MSTTAHPDGRLVSEVHGGPVRVKQPDGMWRNIDTTLIDSQGVLRPKTAKADIRLSTGGGAPFAALDYGGGRSLELRWPSDLAKPKVEKNTAVYPGVAGPAGDLVVTALPAGLRFGIVLNERPAGAVEFKIPIAAGGASVRQTDDGRLIVSEGAGKVLASSARPVMRAAGEPGRAAAVRRAGKGDSGGVEARVKGGGAGTALVLTPDSDFLRDPATKYPVTIESGVLLPLSDDTDVNSVHDHNNVGGEYLSAGTPYPGEVARTYLRFDTTDLPHSVVSAELSLRNVDAPACGPSVGPGVEARRITGAWDARTIDWSPQPANTTEDAAISREGSQAGVCGSGFMRWNVTGIVRDWQAGAANHGIVLRAPAETVTGNHRVFTSSEETVEFASPPKLTVDYRLPPSMPEVTLESVDSISGNDVIAHSDKVKVVYGSTTSGGENVDYSVTVSDASGPITGPPPATNVPSGRLSEYVFTMANPDTFRVSFKACITGPAPAVCNETPTYRITSDAPHPPTDLITGLTEPTNPILSGVLARPSGGLVTGRFFLYDASGAPVGGTPYGEGTVSGGSRVSLRVPGGVLAANRSYTWQMQACVEGVCSDKTPAIGFTTSGSAPQEPIGTHTVVLDGEDLSIRTAEVGAVCDDEPCALTDSGTVEIGGSGDRRRVSLVKADLESVPAGAEITSAVLNLAGADCGGPCPAGAEVAIYPPMAELSDSPTGAEAVADLAESPQQRAAVSAARFDVAGNLRQWRQEETGEYFVDPGLVLLGDETLPPTTLGMSSVSITVKYLPATAPGKVTGLRTRAGHQGVLLTWGKPESLGSDAPIDGYDVQVLNASGGVLRTLDAEADRVIVDGLTNGTGYRFRVRARTAYGDGPWETSAPVAPQAVQNPGRYVEAVERFLDATEGMRDKRYENTGDATGGYSEAAAIAPILYGNENRLLTSGARNRATYDIKLSDILLSPAANGSVIMRAGISGVTSYAPGEGTELDNDWEDQSDCVFAAVGSGFRLTRQNSSGASDALSAIDGVEINAWPGGVPYSDVEPPEYTELHFDQGAPPARDLAGSPDAAASWAVKNVGGPTNKGWEYPNDCANFISKALARGGRYRQIHGSSWSWLDKRAKRSWWEDNGHQNDSWTFAAADNNWNHFRGENRITVRRTLSQVRIGDVIWFTNRKSGRPSHMGIVTFKNMADPYALEDIWYAQHGGVNGTGSGPYMNLGERWDPKEFKGMGFGRVNK
ncbi:DNRLRE domain-containing protein [Spongiactinospora sp. 9N601]|uniref:DNRLRE domain-containing protein n=1 Tax=Spongiactinospora sp. 9N601 TaxID=3375149 RepID=UPI0037AA6D54